MSIQYRRDDFSHGLVNTDHNGYQAYKNRRQKNQKIVMLESQLVSVKTELQELRDILTLILDKQK